jgi:DNA invertase Pin-like site-specific DNA recombinase
MRVGYVRVSSTDQSTARQLDGVALDKVFTDQQSAKDRDRPALKQALAFVREGDTLVVHSLDRLARNLGDLLAIVKELTSKGVIVTFAKENLTFTGKDDPMSTLMMSLLGAVAAFERDMIRIRQREGIAALTPEQRAQKYKGRARVLTNEQAEALRLRAAVTGCDKSALAEEYGISRQTLYSYIRSEDVKELRKRVEA